VDSRADLRTLVAFFYSAFVALCVRAFLDFLPTFSGPVAGQAHPSFPYFLACLGDPVAAWVAEHSILLLVVFYLLFVSDWLSLVLGSEEEESVPRIAPHVAWLLSIPSVFCLGLAAVFAFRPTPPNVWWVNPFAHLAIYVALSLVFTISGLAHFFRGLRISQGKSWSEALETARNNGVFVAALLSGLLRILERLFGTMAAALDWFLVKTWSPWFESTRSAMGTAQGFGKLFGVLRLLLVGLVFPVACCVAIGVMLSVLAVMLGVLLISVCPFLLVPLEIVVFSRALPGPWMWVALSTMIVRKLFIIFVGSLHAGRAPPSGQPSPATP
jgi:hypothetical protein